MRAIGFWFLVFACLSVSRVFSFWFLVIVVTPEIFISTKM